MQALITTLIGSKEKFSLKHRILNLSSVLGGIAFLQSAIIDTFYHQNYYVGAVSIITVIPIIISYIFSRQKGYYIIPAYTTLLLIIFIAIPLLWLQNNGIHGSMPYWIVYLGCIISVLFTNWTKVLFLFFLFLSLISLAVMDHFQIINSTASYSPAEALIDVLSQIIVVSILAAMLISILVQEHHYEQGKVKELAHTDFLSGLFTRRYMLDKCNYEIIKIKRNHLPFSIIICDVDDFKLFNDNHGHDAGDFVIKNLARVFKKNIREQDVISRWGGEEFLLLLPETYIEGAHLVANKLQQCIKKDKWLYKNIKLQPTLSFGVSCYEDQSGKTKIDTCIKWADDALYKSKHSGKNCITLAQETAST